HGADVHHLDPAGTCSCRRPVGALGFDAAMAAGERFVRRLRHARGGDPFAYLLVAEQHHDGHWHLHAALPFQVPYARLSELWGHGRVDDGFSPEHRSQLRSFEEQAALAGGYCGKYLGKSLEVLGEAAVNRQTYRVAEGFEVRELLGEAPTEHEALRIISGLLDGAEVVVAWDSDQVEGFAGPRCWWYRFAFGPPDS
uniref:rolling circle replication-associated protein n=1 Tax=Acinetobacter baumannii TaxID=470 RepID=UPI001C073218